LETRIRPKQPFPMSYVEPASWDQLRHEALDQGCLRWSIEVDHHVTAGYRVERTFKWTALQKIELPKGNERACHLTHSDDRSALAFGRFKIATIARRHIVIDRASALLLQT